MKKAIFSFVLAFALMPAMVMAKGEIRAGFTPDSPFYFLDQIGEFFEQTLAVTAEAKARLQVKFAAERIAEIQAVLSERGVNAPGLRMAEERLRSHLEKAALYAQMERNKGRGAGAKEIEDEIEEMKSEHRNVQAEIDRVTEDKREAEVAIFTAEDAKKDLLGRISAGTASSSPQTLAKVDRLIMQAKELYQRNNYQGAEMLARQAEKTAKEARSASERGMRIIMEKVMLHGQNNSGESGTAVFSEAEGKVKVLLRVSGVPAGVIQPAHIHAGSCQNLGAVTYPLTNVSGGVSETMLSVSLAQLSSELPLAINVHKSAQEAKTYVACGDIHASAMMEKEGEEMMKNEEGMREENNTGGNSMMGSGSSMGGTMMQRERQRYSK